MFQYADCAHAGLHAGRFRYACGSVIFAEPAANIGQHAAARAA